jgi:hypothetical protein
LLDKIGPIQVPQQNLAMVHLTPNHQSPISTQIIQALSANLKLQ